MMGFVGGFTRSFVTSMATSYVGGSIGGVLNGSGALSSGVNAAVVGGITYGIDAAINNSASWNGFALSVGMAMVMGGIEGGYDAKKNNLDFWTGRPSSEAPQGHLRLLNPGRGYGMSFDGDPPGWVWGKNERGAVLNITGPEVIATSLGQGGSNWATATLAFIAADAAIPEPTDVAWPKWVAYGVAGTAAAVYIHANSKNSPKPNIVYEIYSYNSITGYQTMKYGVSSRADFVTRSGNPRPEYQVISLNAAEPVGSGTFYWYTILNRTPDRASALSLEQSYVRAYQVTHGGLRPPLQIKP